MALLHLRSTNPKFSYAIAKNPASGLTPKTMREGHTFGFFPKGREDQYTVYFKDNPHAVSFKKDKDEMVEFMNVSRYNSALFVPSAIGDYFSSLFKKHDPEIDVAGKYINEIEFPLTNIDSTSYLEIFPKYLPDFKVEAKPLFDRNYNLKITTQRSLTDLVNYSALLYVMNVLRNKNDYFEGNENQLLKYIGSLNRLNAPYFIRYVYKVNLIRSARVFKEHKKSLEGDDSVNMVFGNTNLQRLEAVKGYLSSNRTVVEIGCGEGNMTLPLAKQAAKRDKKHYAIDVDEDCRKSVKRRIKVRKLDNVVVLDSFEAFKTLEERPVDNWDIICVEVIEHMPSVEEASTFLKGVLEFAAQNGACNLVVTTPNFDFNKFYEIEGFRHDDHKFEFTETLWNSFIWDLVGADRTAQFNLFTIGDVVEGIPTTLGAQFIFGDENESIS